MFEDAPWNFVWCYFVFLLIQQVIITHWKLQKSQRHHQEHDEGGRINVLTVKSQSKRDKMCQRELLKYSWLWEVWAEVSGMKAMRHNDTKKQINNTRICNPKEFWKKTNLECKEWNIKNQDLQCSESCVHREQSTIYVQWQNCDNSNHLRLHSGRRFECSTLKLEMNKWPTNFLEAPRVMCCKNLQQWT